MQKASLKLIRLLIREMLIIINLWQDRKYFDSGDYALSKAGISPPATVGSECGIIHLVAYPPLLITFLQPPSRNLSRACTSHGPVAEPSRTNTRNFPSEYLTHLPALSQPLLPPALMARARQLTRRSSNIPR